jgi:Flp pilus assembly pilin Flp
VLLRTFVASEDAQDLAEYGLLACFIVIVVLTGVSLFGQNLLGFWTWLAARAVL